jgi:Predicted membrane protein (DUF2306)
LLSVTQADVTGKTTFATWFPPVFFAAVALGTLPVIMTNLFVPSHDAASSVAAIAGREYANEQLAAFDRNPLLIHAHAVVGLALVLAVPFQFWRNFRNRHRQLHRVTGYVIVTTLVLLSTSGLAVSIFYPFAGRAGVIPNLVWMSAILFAVGKAVRCIRRRDVLGHETWMTRAIAMTFGVTFASLYLPVLTGLLHMPSRLALAVSFWLGVGECLGVAEIWLRRSGRQGRPSRRQQAT